MSEHFKLRCRTMLEELLLGEYAIKSLKQDLDSWKISAFSEWFNNYLIIVFRYYQHVETNIILTQYEKLVVVGSNYVPDKFFRWRGMIGGLKRLVGKLSVTVPGSIDEVYDVYCNLVSEFRLSVEKNERYWVDLVNNQGESNWNIIEAMITQDAMQHGDMKAGVPFQLFTSAMQRVIETNTSDNDKLTGTQFHEKRKKLPLDKWRIQYMKYYELIKSCTTSVSPTKETSTLYVATTIPVWARPLVYVLIILVTLHFGLVLIPFLGAGMNPKRNIDRLQILVANFDDSSSSNNNGIVGTSLVSYFKTLPTQITEGIPTFIYVNEVGYDNRFQNIHSPEDLKSKILDHGLAWGAVYATSQASIRLNQSLTIGCQDSNGDYVYSPSTAIEYMWDEGRNTGVASGYISGFLKAMLPVFVSKFAANYITNEMTTSQVNTCISNGYSSWLTMPIFYTEENLTPTSISPVSNNAVTVGNILVAVFGALFVVNMTYQKTGAIVETMTPWCRIGFRCFMFAALGFAMSASFATMIIGLTKDGSSGHIYSGDVWAQIFAIQWIHFMIWSFGHGCIAEGLGPQFIPIAFPFLLLSNITAGWNTDISDVGYKQFYQTMPFVWSINILRYVLFGSLGFRRRISCGILIAYCFVFIGLYVYLSYSNEMKRMKMFQPVIIQKQAASASEEVVVTKIYNKDDEDEDIENHKANDNSNSNSNGYKAISSSDNNKEIELIENNK